MQRARVEWASLRPVTPVSPLKVGGAAVARDNQATAMCSQTFERAVALSTITGCLPRLRDSRVRHPNTNRGTAERANLIYGKAHLELIHGQECGASWLLEAFAIFFGVRQAFFWSHRV